MAFVEVENLHVAYGRTPAVSDLSFNLEPGQALGLLGANGAGKSSTLKALMGMIRPRQGRIQVAGNSAGSLAALRCTGFAPEDGSPPERFTGLEFLDFIARIRAVPSQMRRSVCQGLLADFDLDSNKWIKNYSKGMRRRLVLAQAFIGEPKLLVLDEPLNGLDPLIIVRLRDRISAYRTSGGTLLYSSHILAEVEKSCTDLLVLRDGRNVLALSVPDAVSRYGSVEGAFAAVARQEGK